MKHRARRSLAALFLRYGLSLAVGFAGTVLLSRLVGPEIWGAFAIAQVVYMSSQEILGRGIATYLIKQQNPPSTADIGSTFFLQHLVGLVFLLGASFLAGPAARWYSQTELAPLLFAAAAASYLYAWRSLPIALLERDLDYARVAAIEVLDTTSFSLTAIAFAWSGHTISGLAIALLVRSILSTAAAYLLKGVRPRFFLSKQSIRDVMEFGGIVAASSLLNIVILALPALLGGWMVGIANIGPVQMTISLYSSLLFASAAVLRLSFSAYSRILEYPGELQRAVSHNLETTAAVMVPLVVLFAGLSPAWAPLIFGSKWSGLPVLILGYAPAYLLSSVFWGILSSALAVSGWHRHVFAFLAFFVAVYSALTVVATAKLGPLGVPLAASCTHILTYPFLIAIYRKSLGTLRSRRAVEELLQAVVFLPPIWWSMHRWGWAAMPVTCLYLTLWYLRHFRSLHSILRTGRSFLSRPVVASEQT